MENPVQYTGQVNPACLLEFGQGYEPPTPEDIKKIMNKHHLSSAKVADIVGVNGGRTVRKWTAAKTKVNPETGEEISVSNSAQMPYACWRLLLLYCYEVTLPGRC